MAEQRRTALEDICAGRDITAITQVRGSGMIYGLQASLPVRGAAWGRVQRMTSLPTGWPRWTTRTRGTP